MRLRFTFTVRELLIALAHASDRVAVGQYRDGLPEGFDVRDGKQHGGRRP